MGMDFTFSEDQHTFVDAVRSMLTSEVTPDRIRARWVNDTGIDAALLEQVADLGVMGMLVPETLGGLGLGQTDFIMLAQAAGEVALPEPVVEQAAVVSPLLTDILERGLGGESIQSMVDDLVGGKISVAVAHPINPFVNFADQADWLLVGQGEDVCLIPRAEVELRSQSSVDPSRRIAELDVNISGATSLATGDVGADLWRRTLNRGALSSAAQLLGLAEAMVGQSVRYTSDRSQFGRAIGVNQAVKHLLADVAVQIEYAKPVIYRAAYTVEVSPSRADFAVSHAKVAASRAALMAARHCIQVHGAMGYTWECDLQIWVKRAWALAREWGDEGFHKNRIHEWLLQPNALLGPEFTFGRRSLTDTVAA